ncbi:hypothetical protein Avbf_12907 [Armadillidium vulgare]|nr:hypothetical protein Avbf_12907 [Armadillidium vulgare]
MSSRPTFYILLFYTFFIIYIYLIQIYIQAYILKLKEYNQILIVIRVFLYSAYSLKIFCHSLGIYIVYLIFSFGIEYIFLCHMNFFINNNENKDLLKKLFEKLLEEEIIQRLNSLRRQQKAYCLNHYLRLYIHPIIPSLTNITNTLLMEGRKF